MAAKRKQDDKHLKLLRELGAKPDNKKCFDCEQRGPTYVNMTVGSFVCTRCSGILRGLNPPNRVKSISMTSFTAHEIDFLEKHGNEFCRQTWLGLENSRGSSLESKDEQKVRDYMVQKYERKRWYVPPSQVKVTNSTNSTPEAQTLKNLVSEDSPKTASSSSSSPPTTKTAVKSVISIPMPGAVPGPALQANSKSTTSVPSRPQPTSTAVFKQPSLDLLGDLGGDPFSQPQQQQQQQQQQAVSAGSGGFANFGQAFSSQLPAQAFSNQQPAQGSQPASFDPFGASSTFPASSSFNAFSQAASQTSTTPSQGSSPMFNAFGTTAPAPALQPATTGFAAFGPAPTPTPASGSGANPTVSQTAQSLFNLSLTTSAPSTQSSTNSSSDKYAIFSSLGSDGGTGGTAGTASIDWSGGGGSASGAWSGGGGTVPGASIDWSGGSKGGSTSLLSGGGIDWGPGSNTNIKQPATSLLSSGMSSGPNPFGGQPNVSMGIGQAAPQPVNAGSMGGFGAQPAPQTSGFGTAFSGSHGVPGAMGTAGNMMNGGFTQPQQAGFWAPGQMGGGFGMQPQAGLPATGATMGGAMKQPGFGSAQGGFGAMQGGFGAQTQPGMNMMQPMGMTPTPGAGFGVQGSMGQPQTATGAMGGFGAQPQGMPTGAGGWPQQQSNPFMGQPDGFGSQPQPAQRSTNPFM